jgi:hypothetical protein
MFNALRIGQMDVNEENYQPRIIEEAPRVLKVKIQQVDSPPTLPTLAPTPEPPLLPWRIDPSAGGAVSKLKKKKRKAVKNVNLLSFGEEMNEEQVGGVAGGKIQSSHDVLAKEGGGGGKSHFVNQIDEELEQRLQKDDVGKQKQKSSRKTIKTSQEDQPKIYDQDEMKQSNTQTTVEQIQVLPELSNPTFVSRKNALPPAAEEKKEETQAEAPKVPKPKKMSLVEARRAKYAKQASSKKKGDKQKREEETMAKFMNFQKKIIQEKANSSSSAADHSHGYHGQVTEGDIEHGNSNWIKTTFKCKRHMHHDASKGGDGRAADDYKVIEERNAPTDRKHDRKKRRH